MAPNRPELNSVNYEIYGVYTSVNIIEEIKQRLVKFWKSSTTTFERKNAIFVFPCFARYSAGALVRGESKIKLSYFDFLLSWQQLSKSVDAGRC